MIPIAAEGVTVRQMEVSCAQVGDKGMHSKSEPNKPKAKMDITSGIRSCMSLKLHYITQITVHTWCYLSNWVDWEW